MIFLHKIGSLKKNRPKIVVGFALETSNHIKNAKNKLSNKNCDAIILNKINNKNKIFGSDMNKITFITRNRTINFKKDSKTNIAKKIINLINVI